MTDTFAVVCDCHGTAAIDRNDAASAIRADTVVTTSSVERNTTDIVANAPEAGSAVVVCGNRGARRHVASALRERGVDDITTMSSFLYATADEPSRVVAAAANAALAAPVPALDEHADSVFPGPVVVVGAPAIARELDVVFPVVLVADGEDLVDDPIMEMDVVRGEAVTLDRDENGYRVTVASRVTADCTNCGRCVRHFPDETTDTPVDVTGAVDPAVCPVDAIRDHPVRRAVHGHQIVWPEYDGSHADRRGVHTDRTGLMDAVDDVMAGSRRHPVSVDSSVCVVGRRGSDGCSACADVCPVDAVTIDVDGEGSVTVDPTRCFDCGQCVSVCPTGAIQSPRAQSLSDLVAAVDTAVETMTPPPQRFPLSLRSTSDDASFVVAFTTPAGAAKLARATRSRDTPPVVPLRVPSVAHVPAGLVLYTLARGAGVVFVPDPAGTDGTDVAGAHRTVIDVTDVVTRAEVDSRVGVCEDPSKPALVDAIRDVAPDSEATMVPSRGFDVQLSSDESVTNQVLTRHAVEALLADDTEPVSVPSLGSILVDGDACTRCPTCATLCPTDALAIIDDDLTVEVADCVGCGICMAACPEDAVTVQNTVAPAAWNDGRTVLVTGEQSVCVECGTEFAPAHGIEGIRETLTESGFTAAELDLDRCPRCRRIGGLQ